MSLWILDTDHLTLWQNEHPLIAATVISRNGILVTRNRRDFERVSGLVFEDWSIA